MMSPYTWIKCRPLWLQCVLRKRWVVLFPWVYPPEEFFRSLGDPKWEPKIRHAERHLRQQVKHPGGKWGWVRSYLFNRAFRLNEEAEALAVELMHYEPPQRPVMLALFSEDMAGKTYLWAARTRHEAREAILRASAKPELHPPTVPSLKTGGER